MGMRWPWSPRRRQEPTIAHALGRLRIEKEEIKVAVVKSVAQSNPELAMRYLWGGGRGALQTQPEKSLAERWLEARMLKEDDDGFSKLLKVREFIRQERLDLQREYGDEEEERKSALERTLDHFGPVLVTGLAAVLNPTGFQQAQAQLQAEQQQAGRVQIAEQPQPQPSQPLPHSASQPVIEDAQEDDDNVLPLPVRPHIVLQNLENMPAAVFAQWALGQGAIAGHLVQLANTPDEQLMALLGWYEANPLARDWASVFRWLRGNPEQTEAIIAAIRTMATPVEDPQGDAVGL